MKEDEQMKNDEIEVSEDALDRNKSSMDRQAGLDTEEAAGTDTPAPGSDSSQPEGSEDSLPEKEEPAQEEPDTEPVQEDAETTIEEPDRAEPGQEADDPTGKSGQGELAREAVEVVKEEEDKEEHRQDSLDPFKFEEEQPRRKRSAGRIAFLISLLIILAGLGGAYYYGYQYCGTHFMPGTRINTFDCSNLTEEEVEARFAEAAEHYVVNIRFRGGSTEMLSAKDIGFKYKPDGSVPALLQKQDQLVWPKYFFEDSGYDIEVTGSYDPEKLKTALQALPELQKDKMEEPENAYIQFRSGNETEDGVFEIVPDTEGSKIDVDQLAAGVGDAAARYEEMVDAEQVAGAYIQAEIQADNADLVSRCKELNEIVGASITYVMPDGMEIKLNSDVMVNWLVKDKKGRLVKDDDVWDEHLWAFMQELANNGNTLGMKRQFNSTLRGQITVSGGDYGYMVNQIVEHDLLLEDLPANKKETRKPSYYLTPYNEETENDGIGTSYIEVDLAAQHIWCYVNGELKMDSDCVSGMTSDGHATPTGVFGIMFMKKDATLRGIMQKNGEYEYETKVSYWMPFYNDCGFHDAWWRTAFGGSIYVNDGSHGCINLPVDAAKELFKYCDEKMPVVVYE